MKDWVVTYTWRVRAENSLHATEIVMDELPVEVHVMEDDKWIRPVSSMS